MKCEQYKSKYDEFNCFPLTEEIYNSDEYILWQEHIIECPECMEWDLKQRVIKNGHNPSDFPCVHIAYHSTISCDEHDDPWECPDITLVKTENGYGIPIRDGGSSYIGIKYCPWCGIEIDK